MALGSNWPSAATPETGNEVAKIYGVKTAKEPTHFGKQKKNRRIEIRSLLPEKSRHLSKKGSDQNLALFLGSSRQLPEVIYFRRWLRHNSRIFSPPSLPASSQSAPATTSSSSRARTHIRRAKCVGKSFSFFQIRSKNEGIRSSQGCHFPIQLDRFESGSF